MLRGLCFWEDTQLVFDLQSHFAPVFEPPFDPLNVLSEDGRSYACSLSSSLNLLWDEESMTKARAPISPHLKF